MQAKCLVDTGALLALSNPKDPWHSRCDDALRSLRLPMGTNAVLAELFHLVGDSPRDVASAWKLISSGGVSLIHIGNDDFPRLEALMQQYRDHPMDYADATLVLLAERERLTTVFTIDNNGFETYRVHGNKRMIPTPGRQIRHDHSSP